MARQRDSLTQCCIIHRVKKCMYAEYKNVPVHRVQGCAWSMGNVHEVRYCISLFTMNYDNESPQPDDDLYDTESLQPYISVCNPITIL